VFCLAPPDIPTAQGGATFGAKFLSAELTLNGVISPVTTGAWIAVWTTWQAGNGQINLAGTVVSPAAAAQAAFTVKATKLGASTSRPARRRSRALRRRSARSCRRR
jgi:membrane protein implicated in regulation of membrane protease activity